MANATPTPTPSPPPQSPSHASLVQDLARVARLQQERNANPILAGALQRIAAWQGRRLRMTYDDLATQARYADAILFFQTDLYGSGEFAQRDADVARVLPLMARMLPERFIATVAKAVELHALSQTLDRSLLARLPRADGQFSVAEYCRAYRKMGKRPERERQIRLIGEIGGSIAELVRKPVIRAALRMMRRPARLAGLSALHDFLDRGFVAFRKMGDATEFLATIDARERTLMEELLTGETVPFPDPYEPRAPPVRAATGT
jgi:hypothetical protein